MKNNMKRILTTAAAAICLLFLGCSCTWHEEVYFDTPFVSVWDEGGVTPPYYINKDANNLLTVLNVRIVVSNNWYTGPISVYYEAIPGDGLREGVDYVIQSTTASPLVFENGNYVLPIRIRWNRNADFDPSKDNSLTIALTGSSLDNMVLGYPGPDALRSKYVYIKQ